MIEESPNKALCCRRARVWFGRRLRRLERPDAEIEVCGRCLVERDGLDHASVGRKHRPFERPAGFQRIVKRDLVIAGCIGGGARFSGSHQRRFRVTLQTRERGELPEPHPNPVTTEVERPGGRSQLAAYFHRYAPVSTARTERTVR